MIDVKENFRGLTQHILHEINQYTTMNLNGLGLSKQELENSKEQLQNIAVNIRKSCSGDLGARELTKEVIRDKLEEVITEQNLDEYILFDESATPWTMFEAIVYRANHPISLERHFHMAEINSSQDKLSRQLTRIVQREKTGSIRPFFDAFQSTHSITGRDLEGYYSSHRPYLDYSDKVRILTQMVFASIYGLGVIDTLNYQQDTIEEIHIGMAGVLNLSYDYRNVIRGEMEQLGNHARDKIHVVVGGRTIALPFLSFGDNHELKRVIRNLVKDAGKGDLTEANPRIVADTVDGRRVTVARPPFQDSWGGLIRKFNNVSIRALDDWDRECEINGMLKLFVRSGANTAITGGMEIGKTAFLRACLRECDGGKNIRILEKDSFELNGRRYLPGANVSSFKISEQFTEEEVSSYVRKTTGHIFSVGEVNSLSVANITCNLAKVAPQVLWTSHHNTPAALVADFKNAKLANGFASERLAELEAAQAVNLCIRLALVDGVRRVVAVDEIVPEIKQMGLPQTTEEGLHHIQQQLNCTSAYRINPIYRRLRNGHYKRLGALSPALMEKAKGFMDTKDYLSLKEWNQSIEGRRKAGMI